MSGSGAEAYERHLVPAIFAPWAALLVELAELRPGERVLDAACGTGIVARLARSRVGAGGKVTGVDLNPGMLEVARSSSEQEAPWIAWLKGDLEALPFAAGEFDVVLCQQGLQFVANKAAALRELHRVLRQGGPLVLSVWRDLRHCPQMGALTGALRDHVSPEASQRMSAPCSLASADQLKELMRQGGFQQVRLRIDVVPARISALGAFLVGQFLASPVAADIGALDESVRGGLLDDIQRRLRPYLDDSGLAVPFEAHTITASR